MALTKGAKKTIIMNKKSFMVKSAALVFGAMLASCTQTDIPAIDDVEVDPNEQIKDEVVFADDFTDLVKTDGWGGGWCATQYAPAITTADGRTAQMMENYQGDVNATGVLLQQTVSGLDNGTYRVELYANAFFTSGRGFDSDMADGAKDVAYVFANDAKEYIVANIATATSKNGEYAMDVVVTDGTMTIGLGKDKAGSNWHTLQIKSLKKAISMADAYDMALTQAMLYIDAAQADEVRQDLVEAMSAERTVDNYNNLCAAILASVMSNQSYELIASGTVPTDNLDYWTCTNTQTFHINTWSVEGNPGNDPSGMTTPFVENWCGRDGTLGDGQISCQIPGIQPGKKFYVSLRFRAYSEAGNDLSGMKFFIGDDDIMDVSEATPFTYNGMKGAYGEVSGVGTVDESGNIVFGFNLSGATFNWVAIKDVKISM